MHRWLRCPDSSLSRFAIKRTETVSEWRPSHCPESTERIDLVESRTEGKGCWVYRLRWRVFQWGNLKRAFREARKRREARHDYPIERVAGKERDGLTLLKNAKLLRRADRLQWARLWILCPALKSWHQLRPRLLAYGVAKESIRNPRLLMQEGWRLWANIPALRVFQKFRQTQQQTHRKLLNYQSMN